MSSSFASFTEPRLAAASNLAAVWLSVFAPLSGAGYNPGPSVVFAAMIAAVAQWVPPRLNPKYDTRTRRAALAVFTAAGVALSVVGFAELDMFAMAAAEGNAELPVLVLPVGVWLVLGIPLAAVLPEWAEAFGVDAHWAHTATVVLVACTAVAVASDPSNLVGVAAVVVAAAATSISVIQS